MWRRLSILSTLFRRRVKSAADVLKGIRQHGFSDCMGIGVLSVVRVPGVSAFLGALGVLDSS